MTSDEVSPCVLKTCANTLGKLLELLFNMSLEEGAVPRKRKRANVVYVFKKELN